MKVQEKRSSQHVPQSMDEERMVTRKQKAEREAHQEGKSPKKPKNEDDDANGKSSAADIAAEFERLCKAISEHLSVQQMREILEANSQDSSGSDDAVVPRCQDVLFYGAVDKCPVCGGTLEFCGKDYTCMGDYSEWSTCTYATRDPPRREEPLQIPGSVEKSPIVDLIKEHQDPKKRPTRELESQDNWISLLLGC